MDNSVTEDYIFRVCPACINLTSLDIVSVAILCWTFAPRNQLNSLGTKWHKGMQSLVFLEAPVNETRETGLEPASDEEVLFTFSFKLVFFVYF